MEPLWSKITPEMADKLLNCASHSYAVEDGIHFLVNRTAIRDILHTFMEEYLESYEFKDQG